MDQSEVHEAANEFLQWVEKLLPKEKFRLFLSLFRYPVMTVDLTEQIFNALEKVFDGRDPYYDYQFISPEVANDWEEYLTKKLKGHSYWNKQAFEKMKTAINSILIVDLKTEQVTPRPEPYYYFKDISKVYDYAVDSHCNIEHILFKEKRQEEERLFVYDDESYRVFVLKEDGTLASEMPEVESMHGLGYCPARFFWTDSLTSDNKEVKKSPLSNQLTNLDKLLKKTIDKDHLDLYGAYPIYYGAEVACDYKHPDNDEHCDGGYIKDGANKYILTNLGTVKQCPNCSSKRLAGPGTFVEYPYPDKQEGIEAITPIGVVAVDKGSLEYNTNEVDRLSTLTYTNVVGYGGDMPNDQAVNKLQIAASFESREAVLTSLKTNFEKAQEWRDTTICLLRYGDTLFQGCKASLGTEWYLSTVNELTEKYQKAKEAGAHDSELDSLQDQIMETEHRNNPFMLHRAKILADIEPFRHMTRGEVIAEYQKDSTIFDPEEVELKIKFSNLVAQFERENINVVEFATLVPYSKKIATIKETLLSYGKTRTKQQRV